MRLSCFYSCLYTDSSTVSYCVNICVCVCVCVCLAAQYSVTSTTLTPASGTHFATVYIFHRLDDLTQLLVTLNKLLIAASLAQFAHSRTAALDRLKVVSIYTTSALDLPTEKHRRINRCLPPSAIVKIFGPPGGVVWLWNMDDEENWQRQGTMFPGREMIWWDHPILQSRRPYQSIRPREQTQTDLALFRC